MSGYVVGWNQPGYLPDNAPDDFETFEDAKAFIIGELKLAEDSAATEDIAESLCHLAEDVNLESAPFTTPEAADGYVYWVTEAES